MLNDFTIETPVSVYWTGKCLFLGIFLLVSWSICFWIMAWRLTVVWTHQQRARIRWEVWKFVGRNDICIYFSLRCCFTLLALAFEAFLVFFEVFDKLVLATQLLVILEVVHSLMRQQSLLVKLWNEFFLTPNDIPIIGVHSFPSSPYKSLKDAIGEIGPESNWRAVCGCLYMRDWFSFLMSLRKYSAMVSY